MRALAALCSGVALLSAASFLLPVLPLRWLVLALCFVLGAAMSACVQLAAIRWYLRHVPVLALGGVCAVAMLVLGNLSGTFPLMLLAAALSALTGVLTRHGGQRSRAGGRLLGQVLGFRQFLRRVTPSHLLMRLQRDPQYFYRTRPMQRRWASARCSPGNSATRSWTPANGTMSRTCRARRRASMRS